MEYIDAHVHLCGIDSILNNTPPEYEENIKLTFEDVTTVRDCGAGDFKLRDYDNVIFCGRPITTSKGHLHTIGITAEKKTELQDAVKRIYDQGADFVKICASGGALTKSSSVFHTQYTAKQLEIVVSQADKFGLKVAAHAHTTDSILNCLSAGIHSIEHCSFFKLSDNNYLDFKEEYLEQIKDAEAYLVGTIPKILTTKPVGGLVEFLGMMYNKALEVGVKLVLATDAWGGDNDFGNFPQMLKAAVEKFKLPENEVIKAVTETPAKMLQKV
jgi:imidazolonepropionase-like amidohydrolase